MLKARIYATRAEAERAIGAIDAARNPDGTEEVILHNGKRERRPAKTWAFPVELDDGRFAVSWDVARLSAIEGREVVVKNEGGRDRFRLPRSSEAVELQVEEQPDGRVVPREKRTIENRESQKDVK